MLIMDRPFEAEKLFNAVLAQDPKNAHAMDGLRRVKLAKRTMWTFLVHGYGNQYDTQLATWGGGPTFYTKLGQIVFWVGDGFFRSDGYSLQKITLNGTWEPYYKNFDGYFYVNRTFYTQAPDRTLYTLKGTWNWRGGREYFSVFGGQHDSYLQSDLAQYFAEESYLQVEKKILNRNIGATAQIPVGRFDIIPTFSEFGYTKGIGDFTDGNSRRIAQGKVMYRVLPHGEKQMPIFRVGAAYLNDSCHYATLLYNCPVQFQSVSITSDWIFVNGKYSYGIFGAVPVTHASGVGLGRFNPPQTIYAYLNYKLTESQELWIKFTGVHSANYSPNLFDIVVGMNVRF